MRTFRWIWAVAVILTLLGCGQAPPPPKAPVVELITKEEAAMRREARSLGTKLYAAGRKAEAANLDVEKEQVMLNPVYNDIEQFIFKRMDKYSHRISSITVSYYRPSIQCVIYVKGGDEEELKLLKREADSIVGRVVENLPIVKYLMVKHEGTE